MGTDTVLSTATLPSSHNTVRQVKASRYIFVDDAAESTHEGMSQSLVEGGQERFPETMSAS